MLQRKGSNEWNCLRIALKYQNMIFKALRLEKKKSYFEHGGTACSRGVGAS